MAQNKIGKPQIILQY